MIAPVSAWGIAIVLALMLGASILVSQRQSLGLERDLVLGSFRAALQLVLVGYLLHLVFDHERPEWVFLVLTVMLAVATYTAARRVDDGPKLSRMILPSFLAIAAGSVVALVPVFVLVIVPEPWFEARYLIPISGMIVANAMNVVAQIHQRIFAAARTDRAEIEQWLALGATPKQALARQTREALRGAMIPTINGLFTVGLVALPGMMTGQVVSGAPPEGAVRYQIVIMYQLVIVAAVSGGVATYLARRLLFTSRGQLRTP